MTTTLKTAVAAAVATLAVAGSAAAEESELATFDVQLKGVQESSWEYHHTAQHACDTNADDSGRETYRFHSRKRRVQALLGGGRVYFMTKRGKPATLSVSGKVNREAELHHSPGGKCNVGGGGGGTPETQPLDCGVKRVKQKVTVDYSALKEDFITIDDGTFDFQSPFSNCPAGSYQFPRLLTLTTGGDVIGQKLPAEDLMRYGKSIVVARGVNKTSRFAAEQSYYASIRWTASFTRVRGH
jgi:hypothetical protein